MRVYLFFSSQGGKKRKWMHNLHLHITLDRLYISVHWTSNSRWQIMTEKLNDKTCSSGDNWPKHLMWKTKTHWSKFMWLRWFPEWQGCIWPCPTCSFQILLNVDLLWSKNYLKYIFFLILALKQLNNYNRLSSILSLVIDISH